MNLLNAVLNLVVFVVPIISLYYLNIDLCIFFLREGFCIKTSAKGLLVCSYHIFLFFRLAKPILDNGDISMIFRANFMKKMYFVCLHPLNRCHFYPFLMKIFFSKLMALDCVRLSHPIKVFKWPWLVWNMSVKMYIQWCLVKWQQIFYMA